MVYRPQSAKKPAAKQRQAAVPEAVCYSQWRRSGVNAALQETARSVPPERLLQAVWQTQKLHRDRLRLTDGRQLQVLHPGFWNHESGPDFQQAVLRIGGEPPMNGDVEVDPAATDWQAHGHADNPAFERVVLHVIWHGAAKSGLPTLELQPHLACQLNEMAEASTEPPSLPQEFAGRCRAPLATLIPAARRELLAQAATVRMETKAQALAQIGRSHGWEQALWHGLFRAMGYKHNTWPMQYLAEHLASFRQQGAATALGWQARLLGAAGLLPSEVQAYAVASRESLQPLWHRWWRERDALAEVCLPRAVWRMDGVRPANHPVRRLVLLAHWLTQGDFIERLECWMQRETPKPQWISSLFDCLAVTPDAFWRWHWTWNSSRQSRECPLMGTSRVTDLAMNVVLPWFHARFHAGRNGPGLQRVLERYHHWPSAQDNAVLKLARQRLFGGPRRLQGAAQQQGVLQIVRDFCDHAPATCEDCSFPDLVQSWPDQRDGESDS